MPSRSSRSSIPGLRGHVVHALHVLHVLGRLRRVRAVAAARSRIFLSLQLGSELCVVAIRVGAAIVVGVFLGVCWRGAFAGLVAWRGIGGSIVANGEDGLGRLLPLRLFRIDVYIEPVGKKMSGND